MDILLPTLLSGLILGGLYALVAMGLTLQYGVSRVMNLAFGEVTLVGAFLAYFGFTSLGLNPLLAALVILPAAFTANWGAFLLLIRPLRARATSDGGFEIETILVTFGLLFVLQGAMTVMAGGGYHSYSYLAFPVDLFGAVIPGNRLLAAIVSVGLALAIYAFLTRTRTGTAIRAVAVNPAAAPLVAINALTVTALAFAIGGTIAAASGVMLSMFLAFNASMGVLFTMKALIIVVMGGVGNILGTLAAGFILGLAEAFTIAYLDSGLTLAMNFAIFIAVLLLRPQGLFRGLKA